MKLSDNFDEPNSVNKFGVAVGLCLAAILLIVCALLYINKDMLGRKKPVKATNSTRTESSISEIPVVVSSDLHVSDLDFYDMYKNDDSESDTSATVSPESSASTEEITEANDGKHTLVTDYDGSSDWITISQYIAKHDYDFSNLSSVSGRFKYYQGDKCVSSFGVDISKDQGYVDFNKLKKAGADFVMIRAGQRGYQSGVISEDEYFKDSLKRAQDAGLGVGVYFMSQAVTEQEAVEEAEFVIESLNGYSVNYPVAFVMKYVPNDICRIEGVSRNDKSMIARAFLKKVKEAGYIPLLYGDKPWLIRYVDLSKLVNDFDIWLSMPGIDTPDYPYKFAMWQYNSQGTIDGISGSVNFNISFIDYSIK